MCMWEPPDCCFKCQFSNCEFTVNYQLQSGFLHIFWSHGVEMGFKTKKPAVYSHAKHLLSAASIFCSYIRICGSEPLASVVAVSGSSACVRAKQEYSRLSWIQFNYYKNGGWRELSLSFIFLFKCRFPLSKGLPCVFTQTQEKNQTTWFSFSYEMLALQGGVGKIFRDNIRMATSLSL